MRSQHSWRTTHQDRQRAGKETQRVIGFAHTTGERWGSAVGNRRPIRYAPPCRATSRGKSVKRGPRSGRWSCGRAASSRTPCSEEGCAGVVPRLLTRTRRIGTHHARTIRCIRVYTPHIHNIARTHHTYTTWNVHTTHTQHCTHVHTTHTTSHVPSLHTCTRGISRSIIVPVSSI